MGVAGVSLDHVRCKRPTPNRQPSHRPSQAGVFPWKDWPEEDLDRVIQMAWEDRTPFEAIEWQFGLKENDVRALMRRSLKRKSFEMWRKRVKGMGTKHAAKRPDDVSGSGRPVSESLSPSSATTLAPSN